MFHGWLLRTQLQMLAFFHRSLIENTQMTRRLLAYVTTNGYYVSDTNIYGYTQIHVGHKQHNVDDVQKYCQMLRVPKRPAANILTHICKIAIKPNHSWILQKPSIQESFPIHWLRFFIRSDRSRAICPCTVLFFYYVRAIHSAFFHTGRDSSECSDFRRKLQMDCMRVTMLMYLNFWHQNNGCIILMKSIFVVYSVGLTDVFL